MDIKCNVVLKPSKEEKCFLARLLLSRNIYILHFIVYIISCNLFVWKLFLQLYVQFIGGDEKVKV